MTPPEPQSQTMHMLHLITGAIASAQGRQAALMERPPLETFVYHLVEQRGATLDCLLHRNKTLIHVPLTDQCTKEQVTLTISLTNDHVHGSRMIRIGSCSLHWGSRQLERRWGRQEPGPCQQQVSIESRRKTN